LTFVDHVNHDEPSVMRTETVSAVADGIAIVGMAGRFPGAANIAELWQNLRAGNESVTFFSEEELLKTGISPQILRRPEYVRAKPILDGIEEFDAAFFSISPREAELMDPQHRLFLECAWQAMESSGHDAWSHPGRAAVFATAGKNTYLLFNLLENADWAHSDEVFQLLLGNEKDYLSSRVSYKLNLKGPSITVQSACSSSLVAVHMACQSLLLGECDIALAGGVSIDVPRIGGYVYRPGGILSPDGHCRAFDAAAGGTTFGHGVGVVVLRKLGDALADGDFIHAVIRGTAVNNDGAERAGFTAPSAGGQAAAITEALAVADVPADSITYVEGHGTATPIGDPIEVQALAKALRRSNQRRDSCAIGSVKTNIGHLGAAAGIAGMIKTVLALEHGEIPPSLHFKQPNPQIDFSDTPFFVNTKLRVWASNGPRRAGVSSFGQGGTNAHIVLEEASSAPSTTESGTRHALVISAQTASAREQATRQLADHLEHSPFDLPDIAYTLQVGRKHFNYRRLVFADGKQQAAAALRALRP
jgi:acyl transferase domain-containing protein